MIENNKKNDYQIFEKELNVLEEAKKILSLSVTKDEIIERYSLIINKYEKLLKLIVKVTRISDRTESKLIKANEKIEKQNRELEKAISEIKTLRGIHPICSYCKKIRDSDGQWVQIEHYIHKHSEAEFSHAICPECMEKLYPKQYKKLKKEGRI